MIENCACIFFSAEFFGNGRIDRNIILRAKNMSFFKTDFFSVEFFWEREDRYHFKNFEGQKMCAYFIVLFF